MKKIYFLFALIALLTFAPACHHHHHHHHNDGPTTINVKPHPTNPQTKPNLRPMPKPMPKPMQGKPVQLPR
ncbi:MAG: hypothetical protein J5654_05015 [Victivallales bacterium]|nr:hypothetical protein [Victivallales bacterium]